ncbi:hypothetical protein MKW98_028617, partial [Papaver atlanticum]
KQNQVVIDSNSLVVTYYFHLHPDVIQSLSIKQGHADFKPHRIIVMKNIVVASFETKGGWNGAMKD